MGIERYIKAGVISFIVLIGFVIVFWILPNSINNYSQYFVFPPDENSAKERFLQTPEYQTFKERFPKHSTDFWMNKWEAQFSASAINPENQNIVILRMNTSFSDDRIYMSAHCDAMAKKSGIRYDAGDVTVKPFLETTKCLEITK
ncbi:hypothetical protein [Candidatus Nitrosotenuis cloacae]|uniref:Uncharacterized protein n=1 Tax=Candidatus Nitrosotenuis cloacae TaxID=1603555 RepID=A0A3G1B3V3_9ARCH|nr:hypothetical protein [Candidatus Nitrosotenuis cloacae]AJZ75416.1 hypothetical protein SU86_002345 [Candidatus Nitrosotenuis cloacae]